jgi:hypothetical protein
MELSREEIIQALMESHGHGRIGFRYVFEHIRDGVVIDTEIVDNIIPAEGIAYILNAAVNGGAQFTSWYIGIFEANYTPLTGDTMATFPASSTESTAYDEAARVPLVDGALASGLWSNAASPAEFTMNAPKTIYGGFITSGSVKAGTTGVLLSAVKAGTSKPVIAGDVLKVTAGITLSST